MDRYLSDPIFLAAILFLGLVAVLYTLIVLIFFKNYSSSSASIDPNTFLSEYRFAHQETMRTQNDKLKISSVTPSILKGIFFIVFIYLIVRYRTKIIVFIYDTVYALISRLLAAIYIG